MATHVQVVLKEDVDNLGSTGELVRVRPGYARNYLLPRGLAVIATDANVKQIEHERKLAVARAAKVKQEAQGVAAALSEVTIKLAKQAGEEGKLYGSVTAAEIAAALKSKGYTVDKKKIAMPAEPIRQLGIYEVSTKLAPEVVAKLKVEVVPE